MKVFCLKTVCKSLYKLQTNMEADQLARHWLISIYTWMHNAILGVDATTKRGSAYKLWSANPWMSRSDWLSIFSVCFFFLLDAFLPCYAPFLHTAAASLWKPLGSPLHICALSTSPLKAPQLGAQLATGALWPSQATVISLRGICHLTTISSLWVYHPHTPHPTHTNTQ